MPPKQVTVSCVHLSSYDFLQTPTLASDALAIRIIFPLVRVIQVSCNLTGFASFAGQTKRILRLCRIIRYCFMDIKKFIDSYLNTGLIHSNDPEGKSENLYHQYVQFYWLHCLFPI